MTRPVLITGGSGMIGRWLIAQVQRQNDVTVLTRDHNRAMARIGRWIDPTLVNYLVGSTTEFRINRKYGSLIHLAGDPVSVKFDTTAADEYIRGVENTWRQAETAGVDRALLVSSGAVAGPHDGSITEDSHGSFESYSPRECYAESHRQAEQIVTASSIPTTIARVFAVIGPDMPADGPLAAGQFLAAARRGHPIHVERAGAIRSYLDHVDLARWLESILESGTPGRAYNVGSQKAVSLGELATRIASLAGVTYTIADRSPAERYVPSTMRAAKELGLAETVDLDAAVRYAFTWQPRIP